MALFNFLKPKNQLEEGGRTSAPVQQDEGEPVKTCPKCHKEIPLSRLWNNQLVCSCGYHFRMKSRQRIHMITDKNTFTELFPKFNLVIRFNFRGMRRSLIPSVRQVVRKRLLSAVQARSENRNVAFL